MAVIRCYWSYQEAEWLAKGGWINFFWTDGEMVVVDGAWQMVTKGGHLGVTSDMGIDGQGRDPVEPGFAPEEWIAGEKIAELKELWGLA